MSLDSSENTKGLPEFNAYDEELSVRLLAAFKSQLRTDCTFIVGENYDTEADCVELPNTDNTNENNSSDDPDDSDRIVGLNSSVDGVIEIKCNRLLLCIVSPVLNAMLNTSNMKESQNNSVIKLPQDSPLGFELLVKYSYSDDVTLTTNNVFAVLQIASKYRVSRLEDECLLYLKNELEWKDALLLLIGAFNKQKKQQFVIESCLKILEYRPPSDQLALINCIEFLVDMPLILLKKLLKSDKLCINEEIIFIQCLKWNFVQNIKRQRKESNVKTKMSHVEYGTLINKQFGTNLIETESKNNNNNSDSKDNSDSKENKDNSDNNDDDNDDNDRDENKDEMKGNNNDNNRNTVSGGSVFGNANITTSQDDLIIGKNDVMYELVPFIRFPLMSGKFITDEVKPLNILSDDEILSLLMYQYSPEKFETINFDSDSSSSEKTPPKSTTNKNKNKNGKSYRKDKLSFCARKREIADPKYRYETPFLRLVKKQTKYQKNSLFEIAFDFTKSKIVPILSTAVNVVPNNNNNNGINNWLHNNNIGNINNNNNNNNNINNNNFNGNNVTQDNGGWIGIVKSNCKSDQELVNRSNLVYFRKITAMKGRLLMSCGSGTRVGKYELRAFTSTDGNGKQIGDGIKIDITDIEYDSDNDELNNEYMTINRNEVFVNETIHCRFDFTNYSNEQQATQHPIVLHSGWIGIVQPIASRLETDNDNVHVNYFHIRNTVGEHTIDATQAGQYEIRMFTRDDAGMMIGTGIPITVKLRGPAM